MDYKELATRFAQETRESSTLLYTRCRLLKEHMGTLMNLICRYDATLERLASLAGSEGDTIRAELDQAARESNRDALLAEMLHLMERSANDAGEMEELAAAAEAMACIGDEEIDLDAWAESLARQVRRMPGGQVSVDWTVDPPIPPVSLPGAVPPILAGALRTLAERSLGPAVMNLHIGRSKDRISLRALLQPVRRPPGPAPAGWVVSAAGVPAVVRLGGSLLRNWGGDLTMECVEGEDSCPGIGHVRLQASVPLVGIHPR